MKIYFPLAKIDTERHEVWGYASTEAHDDQGEVVKRDALLSALGDYMKFGNIREMHQLSAVGVAKEAAVDEKGLYVGAKIVDPVAWQKVIEGVYKGYSIGGRVTHRDPMDYKTITGLVLNEISLVDRPANPEAVFDYWKSARASRMPEVRLDPPFQIWACGVPEHRHLAKSDALKCQEKMLGEDFATTVTIPGATAEDASVDANNEIRRGADDGEYADPGYQSDGQKRYPVGTEQHIRAAWNFINRSTNAQRYTSSQLDNIKDRIVAAWRQKIDKDGPPSLEQEKKAERFVGQRSLAKALGDVGHVARIILGLRWLQDTLAAEAEIDGENSSEPSRLQTIINELCDLLYALVAEETSEILDTADLTGEPLIGRAADILIMAGGAQGASLVADLCRGRNQKKLQQLAATILVKARRTDSDRALLDIAHQAVSRCLKMHGLLSGEKEHVAMAREAINAAGALTGEDAGGNAERKAKVRPPMPRAVSSAFLSNENAAFDTAVDPSSSTRMIDLIAAALSKRAPSHLALLDVAHESISKLTNGTCCRAAKVSDTHSKETSDHLLKAHDHLIAAGAQCDGVIADSEVGAEETEFQPAKAASGNLAKILAGERAEKAALIATLADIVPRLDQLTKRVKDIACTPLPPVTIAKTVAAAVKRQDTTGNAFSTDELAAAFSQMSKEEQTLTLIKASHAHPINPPGRIRAKETVGE